MFRRLARSIRQLLTAACLLLLVVAAVELTLQVKCPPATGIVAATVSAETQAFLNPSGTVHHELQRLSTIRTADNVTFETNSFGLRGPEPSADPDEIRILLLGDETILGPDLEDSDTISARLEQFLSKSTGQPVDVINAGVPGYCPLLCWLQFRHQLYRLRPHIIVLHCDMSDIADDAAYRSKLRESGRQPLCINHSLATSPTADNPVRNLLQKSAIVNYVQRQCGFCADPEAAAGTVLMQRYQWAAKQDSDLRLRIQHALSPIERLAADAQRAEAKFMVSCTPLPWQIGSREDFPELSRSIAVGDGWPQADHLPFEILAAACRQTATRFCGAQPAFSEFPESGKLFIAGSTALSRWGTTLYAREIASMLLTTPEYAALFSGETSLTSNRQPTH